jgi:hypothetical protein
VISITVVADAKKSGAGSLQRCALGDFRFGKPGDARSGAVAHWPTELLANRHTRSVTTHQNRLLASISGETGPRTRVRLAPLEDHPSGLWYRPASIRVNEPDMSWYEDTAITLHAAFRGDDLIQCTEKCVSIWGRSTVTY